MILIYSHTISTRLQYICKFILEEQLGLKFSFTIDSESFKNHDGPKINYSDLEIEGDIFIIKNHSLLFEKNIKEQNIACFELNDYKAFFKTANSDFPFDIFAASFYLLSRYEEYLPHEIDMYGRYAHENSLAFKEDFLRQPLINIWISNFSASLKNKFTALNPQHLYFKYTPTYDIDIAWSYKSKGILRNIGGFIKSPSALRLAVLAGVKKDPFDCYEFLRSLHKEYQMDPVYFFLVASSRSNYDKNISPYNHNMWRLLKRHAMIYSVGLHPSWRSNEKEGLLKKEKRILETAGNIQITQSRQHYIKFSLPQTFEALIQVGITDDYSMGYGSINGFRASVASSFIWYNLSAEKASTLRIHPFCFMDANSFYEQKQNAAESFSELMYYYEICKKVNGNFISIFHNNFLGTDKLYKGWREIYVKFISQLRQ
ncbi:MAG: polysaccharide deacetylase family protein [Ferruginibacter sp.]